MQSETTAVALATGMNTICRGYALSLLLLSLFISSPASFAQSDNPPKVEFNIASQPMETALTALGAQSGLTIIVETKVSKGVKAAALTGTYTADEALKKLLEPAGLKAEYLDNKTVAIRSATEQAATTATGLQQTALRLAQNDQTSSDQNTDKKDESPKGELEEIVVTGTHIRGNQKSTSPLMVFDRDDMDRSGAGTVQEFLQRLPQNFASASENPAATTNGRTANVTGGSAVDLRGLGADSTLVLLNGRRIAPGNLNGNFVDISLIPIAAIERIDVMTDGASAIYGSDAVGGVVNFILRRDLNGAETRLRYGTVESGGRQEWSAAQSFGHAWDKGSALLSYQYSDRQPLSAADREYTRNMPEGTNILDKASSNSIYVTLNQELTDRFGVFADASYSKRRNATDLVAPPPTLEHTLTDNISYSTTLGSSIKLAGDAHLEIAGSFSAGDTDYNDFNILPGVPPALFSDNTTRSKQRSLDVRLDGVLFDIPAGAIRYAVGGQYRDESLRQTRRLLRSGIFNPDRQSTAAFMELRVPLIGSGGSNSQADRLQLSLADRWEDYSDFGSTNNPKIGLIWSPTPALNVRGTYGTSFKAPLLNDLQPIPSTVFTFPQFDPLTGNNANVMTIIGGNPDLKPEKADTWTAGFDFSPPQLPGLRASASYFDIHYKERIAAPFLAINITDALRSEAIAGPRVILRDVPQSVVQDFANTPNFSDFCPFVGASCPLSSVNIIVDSRMQNLSVVDTSGIDFDLSYRMDLEVGTLQADLLATYILVYETNFTPTSPTVEVVNTQYNPVDLRLRPSLTFTRAGLTAALFVNYTDSYKNVGVTPSVPTSSWTTADVSLGYRTAATQGWLSGVSALVGVNNVTDKDPPFLASLSLSGLALNFDGSNANPVGRYYYLQLAKKF